MTRGEHYKIGCSGNLLQRYSGRNGIKAIVHVIPVPDEIDLYWAEKQVHDLFSDKNVNGFETFCLTSEDIDKLKSIRFQGGRMIFGKRCREN